MSSIPSGSRGQLLGSTKRKRTNIVLPIQNNTIKKIRIDGEYGKEYNTRQMKPTSIAVFTYGRFQPPTIGHGELIKNIQETAKNLKEQFGLEKVDTYVFPTSTYWRTSKNPKERYPLDVVTRTKYMKKMFPDVNIVSTSDCKLDETNIGGECRILNKVIEKLDNKYDLLYIVLGKDRAEDPGMKLVLKDYGVHIVSVDRDADSNSLDPSAISATKVRQLALDIGKVSKNSIADQFIKFKNAVKIGNMTDEDVFDLLKILREELGLPIGDDEELLYKIQEIIISNKNKKEGGRRKTYRRQPRFRKTHKRLTTR